ncbi:nagb/rpia/CoA transferase-like protein, partial [Teratosphaeria nubilosa]
SANIPAFYTRTGLHTAYAEGKLPTLYDKNDHSKVLKYCKKPEIREFNGQQYIMEEAFPIADFAWIKAWKADKMGNCVFEGTAWNFNRIMASAAKVVIVEANEILEAGALKPEEVHLSGLYVNRLFKGHTKHQIKILKNDEGEQTTDKPGPRDIIAMRAAKEFVPGSSCNLGVGMPTLASAYAAKDQRHVYVQSENGVLGVGGYPEKGKENSSWINAGKETIEPIPGASTFGSEEAFAQIRGGHLDMTVLGALECSQYGDMANYMIPGKMVKGMGGAMDLVAHPEATKVLVVQTHQDKHGRPKIKEKCDLPLTGARCVHTIVTELACFDVDPKEGLTLRDYNPDSSVDEIREKTGAKFKVGEKCGPWKV